MSLKGLKVNYVLISEKYNSKVRRINKDRSISKKDKFNSVRK